MRRVIIAAAVLMVLSLTGCSAESSSYAAQKFLLEKENSERIQIDAEQENVVESMGEADGEANGETDGERNGENVAGEGGGTGDGTIPAGRKLPQGEEPVSQGGEKNLITIAGDSLSKAGVTGRINKIYYGGDSKILVWADKLYLLDAEKGNITASVPADGMTELDCRVMEDGYVVMGRKMGNGGDSGSGGLGGGGTPDFTCMLYDLNLNLTHTLQFGTILGSDFMISTDNAAVSPDGGRIAVAGMSGLFLYDVAAGKSSTLVDFNQEDNSGRKGLINIEKLDFTNSGKKLVFKGQSFSVPVRTEENSFDTYGLIGLDGTVEMNKKGSGYTAKGLTAYDGFAILAEDFRNYTGRLMFMDTATGEERILKLSSKKESGTVYGSGKGEYFATAVIGSDLKLRIYQTSSGKLLKEEVITVTDPLYIAAIPELIIQDDLKNCIVVLGNRQQELNTLVKSFSF